MMIEFLPIKIESTFDWSVIIAILGAITFYFGKLVIEVSPYRNDKHATYVSGAVYLIVFVLFPLLILNKMFYSNIVKIDIIPALIVQTVLTWYLGVRLQTYTLSRIKLNDYVFKITDKKTQEIYSKIKLIKQYKNSGLSKKVYNFVLFDKLSNLVLLAFAILNYWLTLSLVYNNAEPILIFYSVLCVVISLSVIAVLQAWNGAKYPQVIIHMESGERLKGELTKIDEGYINIINKNKIYNIVEDKVRYIEADILIKFGKKNVNKSDGIKYES